MVRIKELPLNFPPVSLRDIYIILSVAETQSFTLAAELLHLSQSAVSRSVNATEQKLKISIFRRSTRSVEPTALGQEFLKLAESIFNTYENHMNEFSMIREGHKGEVHIAALPSIAAALVPATAAKIRQRYPNIDLHIHDVLAETANSLLLNGQVDFAITVKDGLPQEASFKPLLSDEFVVAYPKDHPLREHATLEWRNLVSHPFVAFHETSSIRLLVDSCFNTLGVAPDNSAVARNIGVIAGLVANGFGVTAVPELVFQLMGFANLDSSRLTNPPLKRTFGIAYKPDRPITPAAKALARMIAKDIKAERTPARPTEAY